jgi:uncharacterized protein HemX
MTTEKKRTITPWLIGTMVLIILLLLAGGGYGFKEHRQMKKDYKDSLVTRQLRVDSLNGVILTANNFEQTETVVHNSYYNSYKKEQKLRKDAEKQLFIYRINSRFHNDSLLSNYKFRRD